MSSSNTFCCTILVRYYAIATPSATQRLLLGLLEAPPSWAPDALDAAVQLVELLRAAEDYATGMTVRNLQGPQKYNNHLLLHFLPIFIPFVRSSTLHVDTCN